MGMELSRQLPVGNPLAGLQPTAGALGPGTGAVGPAAAASPFEALFGGQGQSLLQPPGGGLAALLQAFAQGQPGPIVGTPQQPAIPVLPPPPAPPPIAQILSALLQPSIPGQIGGNFGGSDGRNAGGSGSSAIDRAMAVARAADLMGRVRDPQTGLVGGRPGGGGANAPGSGPGGNFGGGGPGSRSGGGPGQNNSSGL